MPVKMAGWSLLATKSWRAVSCGKSNDINFLELQACWLCLRAFAKPESLGMFKSGYINTPALYKGGLSNHYTS